MEHLNFDQILRYVSADKPEKEVLDFIAEMNSHLDSCPECAENVRAFQAVYDRLEEVTAEAFLKMKKDLSEKSSPEIRK